MQVTVNFIDRIRVMQVQKIITLPRILLSAVVIALMVGVIVIAESKRVLDPTKTELFYSILDDSEDQQLAAFIEKTMELQGVVTDVNTKNGKYIVRLKQAGNATTLLCEFKPGNEQVYSQITLGDTLQVRGVYKGKLADAIFQNCVIP